MIKTVSVGGRSYNIAANSATKQVELMQSIGGVLTLLFQQSAAEEVSEALLIGVLSKMRVEEFNRVAEICCYKVFEKGSETRLTVDDFGGRVFQWYQLVAAGLEVNLGDFFDWLRENAATEKVKAQALSNS